MVSPIHWPSLALGIKLVCTVSDFVSCFLSLQSLTVETLFYHSPSKILTSRFLLDLPALLGIALATEFEEVRNIRSCIDYKHARWLLLRRLKRSQKQRDYGSTQPAYYPTTLHQWRTEKLCKANQDYRDRTLVSRHFPKSLPIVEGAAIE